MGRLSLALAVGSVAASGAYLFWSGKLDDYLLGAPEPAESEDDSTAATAPAGAASSDVVAPAATAAGHLKQGGSADDGGAVGRSLAGLAWSLTSLEREEGRALDLATWWAAVSASQRLIILQTARELLRAHVAVAGTDSGVLNLLCPELADAKLERLVPAVPALVHARLGDKDGVRAHDAGFIRASLKAADPSGAAAATDPYTADVLTDNRQVLMNNFLATVLSLVARYVEKVADASTRGSSGCGAAANCAGAAAMQLQAIAEGAADDCCTTADKVACEDSGEPPPAATTEGGGTAEEAEGKRRRQFVEGVEYGDV